MKVRVAKGKLKGTVFKSEGLSPICPGHYHIPNSLVFIHKNKCEIVEETTT